MQLGAANLESVKQMIENENASNSIKEALLGKKKASHNSNNITVGITQMQIEVSISHTNKSVRIVNTYCC